LYDRRLDVDIPVCNDSDVDSDADGLACCAAYDGSLCYSVDSGVTPDGTFSFVAAAVDECSISSLDSCAGVDIYNDLTAPVIETCCSAVSH
jgi:hypothetical protein